MTAALSVLAYELVLTFLAGLSSGLLFVEGILRPRRRRRALISRRLVG
jgi:hypothetical protein